MIFSILTLLACGARSSSVDDTGRATGADDTASGGGDTGETDSGEVDSDDTGGHTGDDTGVTVGTVHVRVSTAIATVLVADWAPAEGADAEWVEYGTDTSYGSTAPTDGPGHALVLGLSPSATIHLRVVSQTGEVVTHSDDVALTTGALPEDLPAIPVDEDRGDPFGTWLLTSLTSLVSSGGSSNGETSIVVFDRTGAIVWYTTPMSGFIPAARPGRDGRSIVYLWTETIASTDNSKICRVDLTGETTVCVDTPGATHDFVELADGSFSYGRDEFGMFEEYTLIGDTLTNMTPDGQSTELWNVWDEVTPVPSATWDGRAPGSIIDWTHFNGMWYDEENDDYYLSFLLLEQVRKVSGASGTTEWALGGLDSTFSFVGTEFGPQHAPQVTDSGIFVFDNGDSSVPSRVAAYDLDLTRHVATETLSIPHPDGGHAIALGDAHLLPNGYLATNYGDTGDYFVFTGDGELVWAMYPAAGTMPGQLYVYDDLYRMTPN